MNNSERAMVYMIRSALRQAGYGEVIVTANEAARRVTLTLPGYEPPFDTDIGYPDGEGFRVDKVFASRTPIGIIVTGPPDCAGLQMLNCAVGTFKAFVICTKSA